MQSLIYKNESEAIYAALKQHRQNERKLLPIILAILKDLKQVRYMAKSFISKPIKGEIIGIKKYNRKNTKSANLYYHIITTENSYMVDISKLPNVDIYNQYVKALHEITKSKLCLIKNAWGFYKRNIEILMVENHKATIINTVTHRELERLEQILNEKINEFNTILNYQLQMLLSINQ